MFSRVSQLLIKNYMMMVMISIITTQRYASMGYAVVMCLSVCLSQASTVPNG